MPATMVVLMSGAKIPEASWDAAFAQYDHYFDLHHGQVKVSIDLGVDSKSSR